jgi:hypothetical protein
MWSDTVTGDGTMRLPRSASLHRVTREDIARLRAERESEEREREERESEPLATAIGIIRGAVLGAGCYAWVWLAWWALR